MREHVRPVTDEVAAQRPALYWVLPVREDAEGLVAEARRDPAVMYVVGAVRLCPKGDPKGLGCSTPKRKRAFDNLVIQKRTGSDLCTTRWMGRE